MVNINTTISSRILAVDDEQQVLDTYSALLGQFAKKHSSSLDQQLLTDGFEEADQTDLLDIELETVRDGEVALSMVVSSLEQGQPFHVVITDLMMPGSWSGLKTAQEIQRVDPKIRILFVSAYMHESLAELRRKFGAQFSLLKKPFDEDELIQQLLLLGASWHQNQNYDVLLDNERQSAIGLEQSYQLMERERRFSVSLTGSMKDGVFALDAEGKLIFMNEAAERLLVWRYEELMGKDIHSFIHPHDPQQEDYIPEEKCPFLSSINNGTPFNGDDHAFQCKNGRIIPVQLTLSQLRSDSGNVNGSVAVFRDISERIEAEASLQFSVNRALNESRKAKKAIKARDDFFASMSHELRTPLTAIIGNCEMLGQMEADPKKEMMIRAIEVSGQSQLALVNDILDLSKIESGKFTIDEAPFDLSKLVNDIDYMLSIRAKDSGLTLSCNQTNPEEYQLIGDQQRIGQILINLIGNAIKFTSAGGAVSCMTRVDGEQLLFTVTDSGIGMTPEVLGRLFQRFEQADESTSSRFGGSGLGLFVSKMLSELMGGEIEVRSEEGKGSTFELKIPYRQSDLKLEKRSAADSSTKGEASTYYGRVLIAEDTPELQLLERRMLENVGVTVVTANNGKEAVELAVGNQFDLVLMDMQMPIMDGLEATRAIREKNTELPVVALTANVMQKHRDAFDEAGCNGFLAKPIDRQELLRILKRYLRLEQDRKALEKLQISDRRQTERRAEEIATTEEDRVTSRRLQDQVTQEINQQPSDVDEYINDELRQLFINRVVELSKELGQAYDVKDWEQIHRTAHTIKGSAASFGFPGLTQLGTEVCDAIDTGQVAEMSVFTQMLIDELERVQP
ncbi:MAG: response regulator [Gammaproteobacteria bacterium]|jgi:PAS domain S-box-containing protein|nr:response regulator [Gammaproteobacteria bacterium]MBT3718427.1 response regulator [Gammaproteobacteria bacterium]MBT3843614.1 response regulator [Gammaproteobacteria bacterium]MBT4299789.1 response regulator [Gammaproteobacteria bacterium]MBT4549292.1 response regulator [Gammaproteobacteria bacterium]